MAQKSTVFKINMSIADLNRHYYADHSLTIARHPTETDLRMMARMVAFALNAHERLQYTKGLSSDEEPDLWQIDLTGAIEHWIDLGQPGEKRIRQSCSKAARVSIYTYQRGASQPWFAAIKDDVQRFKHLQIAHLDFLNEPLISRLIDRTMRLSFTIEDDQVQVSSDTESMTVVLQKLKK